MEKLNSGRRSKIKWKKKIFHCIFRMEAEIVGEPHPSITWYKDGIEIQTTERTKTICDDRKALLLLIDVSKQDAGEYVLKVENELGEITCKTILVVKGERDRRKSEGLYSQSLFKNKSDVL